MALVVRGWAPVPVWEQADGFGEVADAEEDVIAPPADVELARDVRAVAVPFVAYLADSEPADEPALA
ncbi:hypothetical protein [Candidatus Igneacidithiobacillus taiwanensis]|uniref:hypothetical protein n=1 Tax=Candidatus Igneacidithiobacillus taiwanensis TaxID=1945924 RepID=UPI00289B89AB|nr:hypothetical protein [Candidatus Igneacidithiobacillus taiwanensis]